MKKVKNYYLSLMYKNNNFFINYLITKKHQFKKVEERIAVKAE